MENPNIKTAAFFDIDNTLVDGYTQIMFAKHLMRKKEFPLSAYFQILKWYLAYKFKFTNDSSSIMDKSVQIIRGWSPAKLSSMAKECFEEYIRPKIFQESRNIMQEHKNNGDEIILVSSSLDVLTAQVKKYLMADTMLCSKLELQNGAYTGKIAGNAMYGSHKALAMKKHANMNKIDLKKSYAYSDHFSDLPMLEMVGNPKAVNPCPLLTDVCNKRKWEILKVSG